jgi:hypothetical protein
MADFWYANIILRQINKNNDNASATLCSTYIYIYICFLACSSKIVYM